MTLEVERLEAEAIGYALRLRKEFADALAELLLEVGEPEVTRGVDGAGSSSAEVAMYVYRKDDIVDVIEFHVHEKGIPSGTNQELEEWLRSAFEDVLRRQRGS